GQSPFPRRFKSCLYAIAVNKCRAAFRARSLPGSLSLSDNAADVPITAEPSPADTVTATETAALVSAAVLELPPQQRTVVVLRIWDGLAYPAIAGAAGRSAATVRRPIRRDPACPRNDPEPRS